MRRTVSARPARSRLARAVAAVAAACTPLAVAGPAVAAWGPVRIVSATSVQQADRAGSPAISQNGRYVVFDGRYAGTDGVWRRDLANGALELVAADATVPSVSADGRFVAFTTAVALDATNDVNAVSDVYVRDMSVDAGAPEAFRLASAVDGSDEGLRYGGSGSETAQHGALSADGDAVVFTVLGSSNLAGGGTQTTTPAGQVAVRRLGAGTTTLVSTVYDPLTGRQTSEPVPGGTVRQLLGSTATISADGTTVAWFSTHIRDQTRVVANEFAAGADVGDLYSEPLWRRVADGPEAPIRRITGGGDPFNPACPPDGTVANDLGEPVRQGSNPCEGPLAVTRVGGNPMVGTLPGAGRVPAGPDPAPQLSADGWSVALLAGVPMRDSAILPGEASATANAYVVDMRPGLTRWQALRPLTTWASVSFANTPLLTADVLSVAISPDATHVALTTARGPFLLSPPLLLDTPLTRVGTTELYDVDLRAETIRRVTRAFGGGQLGSRGGLNGGAYLPAYSADDRRLTFVSAADDIFYGDGNAAPDVYTADWSDPPVGPGRPREAVSAAPAPLVTRPLWRLGVTARSRRDGRVALEVVVPGAGRVSARAVTTVRTRRRTAASGRSVTGLAGLVVMPLTAHKRFAPSVRSRRGLVATVEVTFVARDGRRLRASATVRFRAAARRAAKRRAATTSGRNALGGGTR